MPCKRRQVAKLKVLEAVAVFIKLTTRGHDQVKLERMHRNACVALTDHRNQQATLSSQWRTVHAVQR